MTTPNKNKTPFYLIDVDNPFYKPLWLRATICISVVLWAALETYARQPFWSVIAFACAAYCVYVLFIRYKPPADPVALPPRPEDPEEDDGDNTSAADAGDKKPD